MNYTITTNDLQEAKQLVKASDMALLLWELKHNFWRKWKHDESEFTLNNYKDELADLFYEYHVDVDDLSE